LPLDFNKGRGIEARSEDGLAVSFKAAVQYRLNQGTLYDLYNKFGEDYKTPCSKYIIDTLNDSAARFIASQYFTNINLIKTEMLDDLKPIMEDKCYMKIEVLTIESATLPRNYLAALTATNAADQEALTVKQQELNTVVEMTTAKEQAGIAAPIVVNNAKATVQAKLDTNLAEA